MHLRASVNIRVENRTQCTQRHARATRKSGCPFYSASRRIAEKSKTLERITDISNAPSYLAAKILRNRSGEVEEAIPVEGGGMLIGSENEAFPNNPDPWVSAD